MYYGPRVNLQLFIWPSEQFEFETPVIDDSANMITSRDAANLIYSSTAEYPKNGIQTILEDMTGKKGDELTQLAVRFGII